LDLQVTHHPRIKKTNLSRQAAVVGFLSTADEYVSDAIATSLCIANIIITFTAWTLP